MNDQLEAIKEAVESEDFDTARELADAYVAANPADFTDIATLSVEDVCKACDAFRAAGMDTELWKIETWQLHHFEPQEIGGTYQPAIRIA